MPVPDAFRPITTPPRTVQVAFDGLLHVDPRPWRTLPLDPTPRGVATDGSLALIQALAQAGFTPVIISDRAFFGEGLDGIVKWLREKGFPRLPITHTYREDVPLLGPMAIGPSQPLTDLYCGLIVDTVAGLVGEPPGSHPHAETTNPEPETRPCETAHPDTKPQKRARTRSPRVVEARAGDAIPEPSPDGHSEPSRDVTAADSQRGPQMGSAPSAT